MKVFWSCSVVFWSYCIVWSCNGVFWSFVAVWSCNGVFWKFSRDFLDCWYEMKNISCRFEWIKMVFAVRLV